MQEIIIGNNSRFHQRFLEVVQSYYQLTKPRIILLLLITTVGGMWLAADGQIDPIVLLATLAGGTLASGAANTINCVYDRDIDSIMARTQHRPLPSGKVRPREALIFAAVLTVLSFTLLVVFTNLLAALLAMAGIVFYVGVYTHLLKRHSVQNIVIGGAAGAIPPLVGWAACTGTLSWTAWVLFAIIFFWTPPHFWALALMIGKDYAQVGVPMLPVVVGDASTARHIWAYTWLLVIVTLLLVYPLQAVGAIYTAIALALGGVFIRKAHQLLQAPEDRTVARSLFKYSILYLMLLCAAIALDTLPVSQSLNAMTGENLRGIISAIPISQSL